MKKTIELTLEQAREMLGKDEVMDTLIRANFTENELNPVNRWENLGRVSGWYIDIDSSINKLNDFLTTTTNRNIFAKKTQAEGVLAMAQLSQLMKDVNGDWKPDWCDSIWKYTIEFRDGRIYKDKYHSLVKFLSFPTAEIRDKFAEDHNDLILEYFKIYQ